MRTITRHSAIVLICSVIISVIILLLTFIHPTPDYSYSVIKTDAGWGYDILKKNKVIIHQEFMPAMQNLKGFDTKEQAEKTAELVVSKLHSGGFPSVTHEEVEKILHDFREH